MKVIELSFLGAFFPFSFSFSFFCGNLRQMLALVQKPFREIRSKPLPSSASAAEGALTRPSSLRSQHWNRDYPDVQTFGSMCRLALNDGRGHLYHMIEGRSLRASFNIQFSNPISEQQIPKIENEKKGKQKPDKYTFIQTEHQRGRSAFWLF